MAPVLLWFRQDLRLSDQPALIAAAEAGPVIPVYVLDDETPPARFRIGGAQRWWLHHSLERLGESLHQLGSRLILRRGRSAEVLAALMEETGAACIHAVRHAEPWWREADAALGARLRLHEGDTLAPTDRVTTGDGKPFKIYAAFWRALQAQLPPTKPMPAPERLDAPKRWPKSDTLASWQLLPTRPDWSGGFDRTPGEAEAQRLAKAFARRVDRYEVHRNLPAEAGTSGLSPHLHFGEISPSTVWHAVDGHKDAEKFRKELAWRDFTRGVITARPDYADHPGNPAYEKLKWRTGAAAARDLKAWQRGRTGYPIVDAGMRQLWTTGWMHNRVRMITGSFLVKHLLIDWRAGWDWYWNTLLDADFGNNSVNWQWVAGTGTDANMFGRIMAPLLQSEKFHAGDYIRKWVSELAHVPDPDIHDPGPVNGYPEKIIGHREGRERALAAGRAARAKRS